MHRVKKNTLKIKSFYKYPQIREGSCILRDKNVIFKNNQNKKLSEIKIMIAKKKKNPGKLEDKVKKIFQKV